MSDYLTPMEYNIEAEQSVIGSMLIDRHCVAQVLVSLDITDISAANQPIFDAILSLSAAGQKIDAVTVLGQMRKAGTYQDPDTRRMIMQIVDATPTSANVGEYIGIVKEASRLRSMRRIAARILDARSSAEIPNIMDALAAVAGDNKSDDVEDMQSGLMRFYNDIEDEHPPEFLPTSIPKLDRALMIEPGSVVILGGYPSDGKTMLALQMALEISKTKKVAFFSYETDHKKLMRRVMANLSGVSYRAIRQKRLTDDDYGALAAASSAAEAMTFDRIEASGCTVADMRARIKARGYEVVFIDYLQIVNAGNPKASDYQKASDISREVQQLAKQLHVTVFALSQLSRQEKGASRPPKMSDLRSSGQQEQDADIILLLSKAGLAKWEYAEEITVPPGAELRLLQIAKNKDGERGTFMHLLMWGDRQRMSLAEQDIPEVPETQEMTQEFIELPYDTPTPWGAERR